MSALEKPNPLLHLDVSAPKGPELHLSVPGKQNPVLHLDVAAPKGPELHLNAPGKQNRVLTLTCLHQ
jgi:hypothetical protein